MRLSTSVALCLLSGALAVIAADVVAADTLSIFPERVELRGAGAEQRVLVTAADPDGWQSDVTAEAEWSVSNPAVIEVDSGGRLRGKGDGVAQVTAKWQGLERTLEVMVRDAAIEAPVSFQLHVQPILAARGCNQGACHGKARGQNGFQLSLLGFDSDFDHAALVLNARGRRVTVARPHDSLLLRKGTGETPHGGGRRFEPDGRDYETLLRWIAAGASRRLLDEPTLVGVSVTPQELRLRPEQPRQLLVMARYSDGTEIDVTGQSSFQSNESAIVAIDPTGRAVAGPYPGEAALMVRYMGHIAVAHASIPLPGQVPAELYERLPVHNFIDPLVWKKLQSLGITPSEVCGDSTFLRRAYLDVIGALPTPDETLEFLADPSSDKRARLIDRLLERPEYADHWANKWADLLRPNPYRVGIKATFNYDNWIRERFRENQPYDEFVRELVTARGSTWRNGAATLFRDRRAPDELATLFSQLFLGVRLECAKCHHHPFERWGQDDFYSFAAYFARVRYKGTGLSPPISGGEEIVLSGQSGAVQHPLTGETMTARPLFGDGPIPGEQDDPREALADWLTHDNPYFAQVMANRVWGELMGRGLVDPVDDLRDTNPASNGPLLVALGEHFRDSKYDIKELIRTIATSNVYQLSSLPGERNSSDTRNHSRHYRHRLRAEVLAQAVSDVTGMPFQFQAMPPESRANQLWTFRVDSLFLDTFGRPDPNQDPPCERTPDSTVSQALHLTNSAQLHTMVTADAGRCASWGKTGEEAATPESIVRELYLRAYCRQPDDAELAVALGLFAAEGGVADAAQRRRAAEDLMWAMINSAEFVFVD